MSKSTSDSFTVGKAVPLNAPAARPRVDPSRIVAVRQTTENSSVVSESAESHQVSALKETNRNLRNVLDQKVEALTKAELEIGMLRSQLDQSQQPTSTRKQLADKVGLLQDEVDAVRKVASKCAECNAAVVAIPSTVI